MKCSMKVLSILLSTKCLLEYFGTFLPIIFLRIGNIFVLLSTSATETGVEWETDTGDKNKFLFIRTDAATEALSAMHALRMMSSQVWVWGWVNHTVTWSPFDQQQTYAWQLAGNVAGHSMGTTRGFVSMYETEEINTTTLVSLAYSLYDQHTACQYLCSTWNQFTLAH